ncbi:MAG: cache domain-containing protein [Pseudomonadota bacterium]
MTAIRTFFRNLPISSKLLGAYASVFIITLFIGSGFINSLVRNTIEGNIESELNNTTTIILSMVRAAATTSIRNHLRAATAQNHKLITWIYKKQLDGVLTQAQAKTHARELLLSQSIGKTGYIYVINSSGLAEIHPNPGVEGKNFQQFSFVREQINRKEGYLEYEWQNPGEDTPKPKSLYMSYFAPWDWIISVTSYRDEFAELIALDDFRDSILALRFGKTGYSFVLDSKGNLILHPVLNGNAYNFTDAQGNLFVREICTQKKGKLIYSWKNPEETEFRDKLVIYNYIPEYDWIVASSCYLEESYAPLREVRNVVLATMAAMFFLALPITWLMGVYIIKPLKRLMGYFRKGSTGDLSVRMDDTPRDEVGQLAGYFNTFMAELQKSNEKLVTEVAERKQAEDQLRVSEEKYRTILERMEEGYYEVDKEGNFTFFNDAFLAILGYSEKELIPLNMRQIAEAKSAAQLTHTLEKIRASGKPIKSVDGRLIKKDASLCDIETSISPIEDPGGAVVGFRGVLKDVTDKKRAEEASRRLEREILDISEREHQEIGRNLHDDLCPHLLGIEVLSQVLKQKLEEQSIQEAQNAGKIQTLIQDSIRKLKRLSKGLYPVDLPEHGFDSALADLAFLTQDIFGVACHFSCNAPVSIADTTVAMHAYYIAHEAIHNAIKHAGAENIFVTLNTNKRNMKLEIADDGSGIENRDGHRGMGLRIMNYRARRIGADLTVMKGATGGTVITLVLTSDRLQEKAQGEENG